MKFLQGPVSHLSELLNLLYQNEVLVIRNSGLSEQSFIELARSWGELIPFVDESFHHPDHPEIFVVSNRKADTGKKMGMENVGRYWHSDGSFLKYPQPISLLWCREAANAGGETEFLSMTEYLGELDPALQSVLSSSFAVHDGLGKYIICEDDLGLSLEEIIRRDRKLCPPVLHPVVITHPVTKKKSLYVNPGFTTHLLGDEEGVLSRIFTDMEMRPSYSHQWQNDDLVIWDNRSVIHRAHAPKEGTREMFRLGVRDQVFYV